MAIDFISPRVSPKQLDLQETTTSGRTSQQVPRDSQRFTDLAMKGRSMWNTINKTTGKLLVNGWQHG